MVLFKAQNGWFVAFLFQLKAQIGQIEANLSQFEDQIGQLEGWYRLEAHLGSLEAYFMEVLANLKLNWANMKL